MTSNFYLGGEIVTGETVTHTYSYDDADWADLLTAYDGHSLTYDAIGNPLTYYAETGFYYLQSRYHDPKIGRFISAGSQLDTDISSGLNLFSYCENNPMNRSDPTGRSWKEIKDLFSKAWTGIKIFSKHALGSASLSVESDKSFYSIEYFLLTIKAGRRVSAVSNPYKLSKPICFYSNFGLEDSIHSSSVGSKTNISQLTLDLNCGFFSSGFGACLSSPGSNGASGFSAKINLLESGNPGIEFETFVSSQAGNLSTVEYVNYNFNYTPLLMAVATTAATAAIIVSSGRTAAALVPTLTPVLALAS